MKRIMYTVERLKIFHPLASTTVDFSICTFTLPLQVSLDFLWKSTMRYFLAAQRNPITLSFSKNLFSSFAPSFAHCRLALFLLCFFKALKSLLSATASQAERSIISYCTSMRYYCPLFSHFSLLSCHRHLF